MTKATPAHRPRVVCGAAGRSVSITVHSAAPVSNPPPTQTRQGGFQHFQRFSRLRKWAPQSAAKSRLRPRFCLACRWPSLATSLHSKCTAARAGDEFALLCGDQLTKTHVHTDSPIKARIPRPTCRICLDSPEIRTEWIVRRPCEFVRWVCLFVVCKTQLLLVNSPYGNTDPAGRRSTRNQANNGQGLISWSTSGVWSVDGFASFLLL